MTLPSRATVVTMVRRVALQPSGTGMRVSIAVAGYLCSGVRMANLWSTAHFGVDVGAGVAEPHPVVMISCSLGTRELTERLA